MKKRRVQRHEVVQPLDTSYRYIPLTKGYNATVDEDDFAHLMQWNWYVQPSRGVNYAAAHGAGKMHQLIFKGEGIPDHKDGDGLNNRKSNIRPASVAQNCANSRIDKSNTSGFKGVSKLGNRWKAKITANCREFYLGLFKTPEEAARAYDAAARLHHEEFAYLNFPTSSHHAP